MARPTRTEMDLETWPGAGQYRFFRGFERPHFAVTTRIDVSALMARKAELSVFRSCVRALGVALNRTPQMRLRFEGDRVFAYDRVHLSATIATRDGDFRFAYFRWMDDPAAFDAHVAEQVAGIGADAPHDTSGNRPDMAYLSCLPWMDYTALDNAMPQADDPVPRISWGKIVPKGTGYDMALTAQVHHALVQGAHLGDFFGACQAAFDSFGTGAG